MSITVICPTCQTTQHLDEMFAGKAIACSRCHTRIDVPAAQGTLASISRNPLLDRVVGRRQPLFVEMLGIKMPRTSDFTVGDGFRMAWSLRHIFILFVVLVLFLRFNGGDTGAAGGAAPFFFFVGVILVGFSWVQANGIARREAPARSSDPLSKFLFPILFVFADFRAGLPAVRTFFLALILILSGLQFASDSGNMGNLVPLPSFSFSRAPANRAYHPPETKGPDEAPAAASAPAPKAPSPDDVPLPPPDDPDVPPAK